jgi:hypothetical protein
MSLFGLSNLLTGKCLGIAYQAKKVLDWGKKCLLHFMPELEKQNQ